MHRINKDEIVQVSNVLSNAFFNDPIWKGFVPDDNRRKEFLPLMFEFTLRFGYRYGSILVSGKNIEGAAVWFAAKKADINIIGILFGGFFLFSMNFIKNFKTEMKIMEKSMKVIGKDRKRIMKGRNYYYLMAVGVSPEFQGKGHGGILLKELFSESDKSKIPFYLETETEENVKLYKHYGFKIVGERDFPDKGFHLWQMIRDNGKIKICSL